MAFDELLLDNNKNIINNDYYCSTINFLEKYEKITIRIKDSKLSFYFNSSLNLFSQCLRDLKVMKILLDILYILVLELSIKINLEVKLKSQKLKEIKNKELIFNNERFNNRKKQKNIIKIIMLFFVSLIFNFFYPEFIFDI